MDMHEQMSFFLLSNVSAYVLCCLWYHNNIPFFSTQSTWSRFTIRSELDFTGQLIVILVGIAFF